MCRRGHVTKSEVGAIRITTDETMFEVPRAVAPRFADALKRTASEEQEGDRNVNIVQIEGRPRDEARQNRKGGKTFQPGRAPGGRSDRRPGGKPGGFRGPGGKPAYKAKGPKSEGGKPFTKKPGFKKGAGAKKPYRPSQD